jgi:uncharacterized cupredoxin-like copper-binding protein
MLLAVPTVWGAHARFREPAHEYRGGEMTGTLRRVSVLIAIAGLVGACSGSSGSSGPISATVKEWQISLGSNTAKAGAVTFNIKNDGDKEHEFVIRKTDLKSDSLPLNADGEVSEDATELSEVGDPSELAEIQPGTSDNNLTVTLQPGHYVIFCNLHVEDLLHYQKGMHTDFTVN